MAFYGLFRNAQNGNSRPETLHFDSNDKIWKYKSLIWIPQGFHELQLKILVTAHCDGIGHLGCDATTSIVFETFHWNTLKKTYVLW